LSFNMFPFLASRNFPFKNAMEHKPQIRSWVGGEFGVSSMSTAFEPAAQAAFRQYRRFGRGKSRSYCGAAVPAARENAILNFEF